jgi:hypothetical protein
MVTEKEIDYTAAGQADVWVGRNIWLNAWSMGLIGLLVTQLTHRRCSLELNGGQLALKRGKEIFNSPTNKVRVQSLSRSFGGLKLDIDGKKYSILFTRPSLPVSLDLGARETTKWLQLLLSAGAVEI